MIRGLILSGCIVAASLLVASPAVSQDSKGGALPGSSIQPLSGTLITYKSRSMSKMGADLWTLAGAYQAYVQGWDEREHGPYTLGPVVTSRNPLVKVVGDRVVIDAVATGDVDALRRDLEALGLEGGATFGRMVSGRLPVEALDQAAALGSLLFFRPAGAMSRVGLVDSQGDAAMNTDDVRATFGIDGTGVIVGTLSDTFDFFGGAAGDVASGDLPAGFAILDDSVAPGIDEGRAMMQLIHDVAPGASQAFHTAFGGQADFALGIQELAGCPPGSEAGCTPVPGVAADVIVDDVFYFAEPMFQDGIIAQAVDSVKAAGVSYFSSAGNDARDSYESAFRPSGVVGVSGERHDFDPGGAVDDLQSFTLAPGETCFSFQWDEPFASVSGPPGSTSDLDIIVYEPPGLPTGIGGFDFNIVTGDPVEVFCVINLGVAPATVELGLELFAGPAPGLMKYIFFGPSGSGVAEFDTASSTVFGHPNARGAEAVGAAFYDFTPEFGVDPALLEPFSSAGPTPILFETDGTRKATPEVRLKPEIVGPDGTNTTFFGFDVEPDGFPNFFGTSASAPHAAGVAALMKQTKASLTPDEVYSILEDTALDMDVPGFDFDTGFGFIDGFAAVDAAATDPKKDHKRLICHKKGKKEKTKSVSKNAVPAHLGHGDKYGPCS